MQTIAKRIANEDIESGSISVNCSPGKTQFNICELKSYLIFSNLRIFFRPIGNFEQKLDSIRRVDRFHCIKSFSRENYDFNNSILLSNELFCELC